MIAVSSKGQSFRAIARYLAAGRSGEERERVEWSAGRNLPTADPELAGVFMRATAEQNVRVQRPVYHLVLSFDPGDAVERATMERVADRVLDRVGLSEHQAVVVAHRDRAHPHMHILVNRVHPESGRVWDLSFDYRAVQEVLRLEERELGVREVPGTLFQLPEQEPPEFAIAAGGERRRADRLGVEPFVERVRGMREVLREANSWPELETRLAVEGMWLERRGRGLVVTDGTSWVRASRVGPELSLKRLEVRFGVSYSDRLVHEVEHHDTVARPPAGSHMRFDVPVGLVPDKPVFGAAWVSPAVRSVAHDLRTRAEIERAAAEHYRAGVDASAAQARARQLEEAAARTQAAKLAFVEALRPAFRDPDQAVISFRQVAATRGVEASVRELQLRPETLGALNSVAESRALGLVRRENEHAARAAAGHAAGQGRALIDAERDLSTIAAEVRGRRLEEGFLHALGRLYQEPGRAAAAFQAHAGRDGVEHAAKELRARPTAFGLVRDEIAPSTARCAATRATRAEMAARAGTELLEVRAQLRAASRWLSEAAPSWAAAERVAGRAAVERARDRQRHAAARLQRLPGTSLLERGIAAGMRRLTPAELEQLRRAVTAPQIALAARLRATVRESVLGSEGIER